MSLASDLTTVRRGLGIRLLAGGVDILSGAVVALLLSGTLGRWLAGRAVVTLSIGAPDTFWRGPIAMIIDIFGSLTYGLPFALLLVLFAEAPFGAGPGKWLLRMHVTAGDGCAAPIRSRLLRWTFKCGGLAGIVLALILGSGGLAFVAVAYTLLTLAGFLLAAGRRSLALHDRLSGTAVYSTSPGP